MSVMINDDYIETKFAIGAIVKHKFLDFRGVIYDVDPEFNNTEEWYLSIPQAFRPKKEQPFYHLLAENGSIFYNAYVSEQNLLMDEPAKECRHPEIKKLFSDFDGNKYQPISSKVN
mgnify:CR=1 FL=1|tara:strand:- start:2545 stop:2892 length:348 start_codon:yes stop_codon:yes gene_type:complete